MLSEDEIRKVKQRYEDELESIVDPVHKMCNKSAISTLELVLND